jgi:tripartite-type tricarboxylate transporter receptor subunit TctC
MGILGVTAQVLELHRSGKIRVLAVTGQTRLRAAPDLPTASEWGLADVIVAGSIGLLAPTGTPRAIVEQIAQMTRMALADSSYQQLFVESGMEATVDSTSESFRQALAADVSLWTPIVKSLGLKLD